MAPIAELRANALFTELDDDQLRWLGTVGEHLTVDDGAVLFAQGAPAEWLVVLVEGELVISHHVDGRDEVLTRHSTRTPDDVDEHGTKPVAAHGFTGETPLLAGEPYSATATAAGPTRVVRYTHDEFMRMMVRCPQVCRVLLPVLAWRIHASAAQAGQRATVGALGTMAAGLAHELNNPAASVVRAAGDLTAALAALRTAATRWAAVATPETAAALESATADALGRAPQQRSALDVSDAEDAVEDWLADHDTDAPGLAGPLVERGLDDGWLDDLAAQLPEHLDPALAYLGAVLDAQALADGIGEAGGRIFGIVAAAKEYTNLDRAPEQDVDLARGIDATLSVLAPRLSGIRVEREYSAGVPEIAGYPAELNQVWTTLIENAADVLDGSGTLLVRTSRDGPCVVAEVIDSGPGIPPDVLPRIFDPFFTTKDIGKGSGLGLHLAHRIVTQRHGGTLAVRSRPGRTHFLVRLPVAAVS